MRTVGINDEGLEEDDTVREDLGEPGGNNGGLEGDHDEVKALKGIMTKSKP